MFKKRTRPYKVKCRDCFKYKVYKNNEFSCDSCKEVFDRTVLTAFEGTDPFSQPLSYYIERVPLDVWQFVETLQRLKKSNQLVFYKDGF